jgi:hypothetical protein
MNKFLKVFGRKSNPYFNHEGYPDPTAYHAIKSVMKEDGGSELHDLVKDIKEIVALTDFEIVGRITFRHKKNGKIFK